MHEIANRVREVQQHMGEDLVITWDFGDMDMVESKKSLHPMIFHDIP